MVQSRFHFIFFLLISQTINGFAVQDNEHEIVNILQTRFTIRNQVWGVQSDASTGLVYLATNTGLLEYDGLKFASWDLPGRKTLRSICIDPSGKIFTGGFEEFGYWQRNTDCNLEYHSLSDSIQMGINDEIWKIYATDSAIYFQSFTSIYIYNFKTTIRVESPGRLLFMFKVGNIFWGQVLDVGLYLFENKQFNYIEGSELFGNKKIHTIIELGQGLLIGTENHGIYRYQNGQFSYWDSPVSEYLKFNTCNAGLKINDSSFVYGTILDGIVITNSKGEIEEKMNFANGLGNNTVLCLSETNNGGLWIGLDEGVNYIDLNSRVSYFSTQSGSLGTIYAMLIDDDKLYLGSNHGLFETKFDKIGMNFHFHDLRFIPGSQSQVWALSKIDHQILCGHNEGTYRLDNMNFQQISSVAGGWNIKPLGNYLIEGTYTGLVTFEKNKLGEWTYRKRIQGFYEPSRHLEIDYLGYIWVSHPQKGIYRLEINDSQDSIKQIISFANQSKSEGVDDVFKLNNRIVFTSGNGFLTYDYVKDSIIPFNTLNNSLGEFQRATQIVPYEKNLYWFVYNNKLALFRISIEFETTKVDECIITDAMVPVRDLIILPIGNDGYIVSNRNGFALIKKNLAGSPPFVSKLFLKNIYFHGKNHSIKFCPQNQEIKVPFYMNNITINIADPSVAGHQQMGYMYRIREVDDRWNYTKGSEIQYFHLKPGQYHFEIKPTISDQDFISVFTILPPWYFTIWAYLLYGLIAVLIGLGLLFWFRQKLEKQKKLVEFEVRQTSLENKLQNTNLELMLTMRYLIQKNETLTKMREEINNFKDTTDSYPTKFLKKMDNYLATGLELQTKEWQMAINNLKLSQEGYFKKLKENFPLLTTYDIRMCSYLRMNFNSKEIAHLLNISTRAVEISRYRLRKKLNLSHEQNLTDFLMQDEF